MPYLVLKRRPGEAITLDVPGADPVTITLVQLTNGQASIGIEAPREVSILRDDAKRRAPKGDSRE